MYPYNAWNKKFHVEGYCKLPKTPPLIHATKHFIIISTNTDKGRGKYGLDVHIIIPYEDCTMPMKKGGNC